MTTTLPVISADDPIEGDFKDLKIVIAKEEHHPAIVKHMIEYYLRDEPMNYSLKDDSFTKDTTNFAKEALFQNNGQSLVALDKRTGEVAGFRISKIVTKELDEKFQDDLRKMDHVPVFYQVVADLFYGSENIFDKYNVDKIIDFAGLSVGDKYRQMGLGYELLLRCLRLAKKSGISLVRGCFSSLYSRKPAEKLGFKVYNELVYKDYKINGDIVFKNMDPHPSVVIAVFELL